MKGREQNEKEKEEKGFKKREIITMEGKHRKGKMREERNGREVKSESEIKTEGKTR